MEEEKGRYFEKVKSLVTDEFLDNNLKCRKKINNETQEEEMEVYLPLKSIDKLNLGEEEEAFLIEYLNSKGIKIKGSSSCYAEVYDNYTQERKLQLYKNIYKISEETQKFYLKEYEKSRDAQIRNELIEANMYLVKIISEKYQRLFSYDYDLLVSYGNEAIIQAIENYDSSKGGLKKYIGKCISLFMIRNILRGTFGASGEDFIADLSKQKSEESSYYGYFDAKRKVAQKFGEELEAQPELIEEVALELEKTGYCKGEKLEELKTRISINNPYSYEEIEEMLFLEDDDTLYKEALETVYQKELVEFFEDVLEEIPERKREALKNRYGLGGRKIVGLEALGKKEGVTHEAIRLRCKDGETALKNKMKYWTRASKTKSFLENCNHEYEGVTHNAYIKRK